MSDQRTSSGGSATTATSGMWGKKGRGYPELTNGGKGKGGK